MTARGTALKDFMIDLQAALDAALAVPVHRGRPIGNQPSRAFIVVGAAALDGETEAARTRAEWAGNTGYGQRARDEHIVVNCLAVYRATSEAAALDGAIDLEAAAALAVEADTDMGQTYDAMVTEIASTRIIPTPHGPVCALTFVVEADASLVG